jgi:DNA-binding CsgD family transcriptional regulator
MPVLGGVLDAIAAGYCHQLGRWDDAEALLTNLDHERVDGVVQLAVAALLDASRGAVERAGDRLEIVRANTLGLRDGRLDGLLFSGLAERAWGRGHHGAIPDIVEEGIERTTDKEMIAWLALVGLRAADAPGEAADSWLDLLGGLGMYADARRLGPAAELRSAAATGAAERTRLAGSSEPDAWSNAVAAWERTGFPFPAAYSRWRHAEAVLLAGGSRDEAVDLFAAAHSAAVGLGARPLAAAIEQAARRARLAVGTGPAEPQPAGAGNDFGITAREFEVLELLARGWTNKQIAESLFISEKTARVHVSHLLTKLAVSTRGAAVDVAFRNNLISRGKA